MEDTHAENNSERGGQSDAPPDNEESSSDQDLEAEEGVDIDFK